MSNMEAHPGGRKKWNKKKGSNDSSSNTVSVTKFTGGKEEMNGNYFDCTGHGNSDKFVKTTDRIAILALEFTCGGTTHTEVKTQTVAKYVMPTRPTGVTTTTTNADGVATQVTGPPDPIAVIDYSTAKKTADYEIRHEKENHQQVYV